MSKRSVTHLSPNAPPPKRLHLDNDEQSLPTTALSSHEQVNEGPRTVDPPFDSDDVLHDSDRPLKILTLDGGGARGLSSLLILKKILEGVNDQDLRPSHCFDLVCGTGTGGISALFLGRLGMTTADAINKYMYLIKSVFQQPERSDTSLPLFHSEVLEQSLKDIIQHHTGDQDALLATQTPPRTRTAVLAVSQDHASAPPHLFRSYRSDTCTIWEAAMATSALPGVFNPVYIGQPKEAFVDPAFGGYNNPTEIALQEASEIWPNREVGLILSIGTGVQKIVSLSSHQWKDALVDILQNSTQVDQRMVQKFTGLDTLYSRFNVDRGLEDLGAEDWDQSADHAKLTGITHGYLRQARESNELKGVVAHLKGSVINNVEEPDGQTTVDVRRQNDLVNTLPRVPEARYNSESISSSSCLEGTRTGLLREIYRWVESGNFNEPRIFWLSGLAGTGKSTVARTIAEELDQQKRLGASFFFSRDDSRRSDPRLVFSTIAHQLAFFNPRFKKAISEALEKDPDIDRLLMQVQLQQLIIKPLQGLRKVKSPIIVVMDALDECSQQKRASEILLHLASEIRKLPFLLKFFITSRPEHYIRSRFDTQVVQSISKPFVLHDIELSIVQADIERYLRLSLAQIGTNLPGHAAWLTDKELETLVEKSSGLFIFASTAVKFIEDEYYSNPRRQLDILLDARPATGSSPYSDLDELYIQVLRAALPNKADEELSNRFQVVVGSIVLLRDPLPLGSLEMLLKLESGSVKAALKFLSSVIVNPTTDDQLIRIIHPSFPDFLTQPQRCPDPQFFIDSQKRHGHLALRCLDHMKSFLRRDICQIKDTSKLNSEVEDLDQRLDAAIPPDLRYACLHWASHLTLASPSDPTLLESLRSFCFERLLYWLEALSLMGRLDVAIPSLQHVQRWLTATGQPSSDLAEMLYDAYRFALEFFEPIRISALHIYYSSLPFTPPGTLLYKTYQHELASSVKVLHQREKTWMPQLRTIEGHQSDVTSVAFSPDGTRIVSGSSDGTVRLWDSTTGAPLATLEGHSVPVTSVAFSPDGTRIVSGSRDRTVRLWDSTTGAPLATLEGHSVPVTSVAFSPDGTRIVSGSGDRTVRLWDSTTGAPLATLEGHSREVTSVAFSPDGTRIVSGSGDRTVRLWDSTTGAPLATLEGHSAQTTLRKHTVTMYILNDQWLEILDGSKPRRICWLPVPSRGALACNAHRIAIRSARARLSILDLSHL